MVEISRAKVYVDVTNALFKDANLKPLIKQVFDILEREAFWELYEKYRKKEIDFSDSKMIIPFTTKLRKIQGLCLSETFNFIKENKIRFSKHEKYISRKSLSGNVQIYYLLTKKKNIGELMSFLGKIIYSHFYVSPDYIRINRAFGRLGHLPPEERRYPIYGFYLALKWFYSEKTKHLYTKNLLDQIKQYEESELENRLNIKSIEDSLRRARNFHVW